jgi:iron(III) transport system permease protein
VISFTQTPRLLLLLLVLALIGGPVLAILQLILSDNFAGLRELMNNPKTLGVLVTTLKLALLAAVASVLTGLVVALAVQNLPAGLRRYASAIPLMPMLIPAVAHVIGFVFLFSPENGYINTMLRALPFFSHLTSGPINIYSEWGIITYTGLHLSTFVYLFISSGLKDMGNEYANAASVCGASPTRTLFKVVLPALTPAIMYSSLVSILMALGQFTAPLILGRREGVNVITTEIYLLTSEYPLNYALCAAYALPLMVVALVLIYSQTRVMKNKDRYIGRGNTLYTETPKNRLSTFSCCSIVVAYLCFGAILPILALTFVALSPFWSGTITFGNLTLANIKYVLGDAVVIESFLTTMKIGGLTLLIVLPLGMLVSLSIYFTSGTNGRLAKVLDVVATVPLAVPGALMSFGFLYIYSQTSFGLYGSAFGLILALVCVKLPYSVRYQLSSLIALGGTQIEAARVSGLGPVRIFFSIILPLAKVGITASAIVILVMLVQEFGVTVMLRGATTNVMSVVLYDMFSTGGIYPRVAAMALVMTFITLVGVLVAIKVGGTKAFEGK